MNTKGLSCYCVGALNLPFNIVFVTDSLENVEDSGAAVMEVSRDLKPRPLFN